MQERTDPAGSIAVDWSPTIQQISRSFVRIQNNNTLPSNTDVNDGT
jgi:hypothetical protein